MVTLFSKLITVALASLALPQSSWAFSLTPMSVEFEPKGKEATKSFLVDNTSGERIAVQVSMAKREIDIDGKENNPEADDDFIVYPPQLVLGPKEKRTIRVTWAGDSSPKAELSYRIIAEQLPVDAEKRARSKNTVIKMLLRYLGAVYITPHGAKPELVAARAEIVKAKDAKSQQLALTFENKGTAHRVLKDLKVAVSTGNKTIELSAAELKPMIGQNVLAGAKRRFLLAWPGDLPRTGDLKFEFTLAN